LNIATNGGLTIVTVVRFTGTPGSNHDVEVIIDLGSGTNNNNILLSRRNLDSVIWLEINNYGSRRFFISIPFVQDSWLTVVVRYLASTREFVVKVNNDNYGGYASEAVIDRTVSETFMGKSHWENTYFNGDMVGVFVVDEYLSTGTTSAIVDSMVQGVDLSNSELCDAGPCVRCEAGTYKRTVGWSSALTVRPTLYVH
jgi:hypothetical protein